MGTLEAAREAYLRGWSLIPLREGDKRPNLPIGHDFLSRRPSEDEYKEFVFGNYGIVTGALSGICVLDIDGQEGYQTLRGRDEEPDNFMTPAVVTPRGVHYYFKYNPKVHTGAAVLGKGSHVDIRSDGSYVVGPGSTVDGVTYRWMEDLSPDEQDFADPPAFMLEHKKKISLSTDEDPLSLATMIPNGTRNTTLISVGGSLVKRNLPHSAILGCLTYLNDNWMESPMPDEEVYQIAVNSERYRED